MSGNDQSGRPDPREKTVKTAGRIVKYSREIYHTESVEEVAMLTMEATPQFIDGYPSPAVVEIREGNLRVLESMLPGISPKEGPGTLAQQAYETENVVISAGEETEMAYGADEPGVIVTDEDGEDRGGVTIAAPTIYREETGNSGAVIVLHWASLDRIEEYHLKPVDYFAEHIATAVVTIRARERLERAHNDLAKRKEMIEVYDRLLRHDLGNDLQVIAGFSEALTNRMDDANSLHEYAEKIQHTAQSSANLIDSVGDTVKTLQREEEPEARDLEPIMSTVVENVRPKFESLTVEYDPTDFEYRVFTGDLIDSVFTNILSNAAVHNEGPITVRLWTEEPAPGEVRIRMADDGKGVPEAVRDEIFEMGQKGPESDGTGFGLGLARTLVESYGGAVEVEDSEWDGADFRITLDRT